MPFTPFSAGRMGGLAHVAEWDGSNHADILDWLRDLDPQAPSNEADKWQIGSVDASELVLARPSTHPAGATQVTIPVNYWVNAFLPASGIQVMMPQRINPSEGWWTTTDPWGRPNDVNDILAP
jgi:hypothetical protein